jgi:Circadian oscillating protein COP23
MKLFLGTVAGCLGGSLLLTTSLVNAKPASPTVVKFYCGQSFDPNSNKIVPTTVVATSSRKEPIAFIQWKSTEFSGYTPEVRCSMVSGKLQKAWEEKRLKYLISGKDKSTGQGIICGVKALATKCNSSNMLFTLSSDADAKAVISRIEGLKKGTTSNPVPQSSGGGSIDIEELVE